MKTGIELIAEERTRQVSKEGWTAGHDDHHRLCELSGAAMCYIESAIFLEDGIPHSTVCDTPDDWPWDYEWWKPSDNPVRNLVKAGALIAAEIDRLQRQRERKQEDKR